MDEVESSMKKIRKPRRNGYTRRIWTYEEEAYLVEVMLQLVNAGYRARGGGFKPGYMAAAEEEMNKKFPNNEPFKADPHIQSKLNVWKKQLGFLKDLLGPSGNFSLDPVNGSIKIDNEQLWNDLVKRTPDYASYRTKRFPHYDKWLDIFGNDRATGQGEDPSRLAACTRSATNANGSVSRTRTHDSCSEGEPDNDSFVQSSESQFKDSASQSQRKGKSVKRHKGSRIIVQPADPKPFLNVMSEFANGMKELFMQFKDLLARPDDKEHMQRDNLFSLLERIPGLNLETQLQLANKIGHDKEMMQILFSIPGDEHKAKYVYMIMNNMLP